MIDDPLAAVLAAMGLAAPGTAFTAVPLSGGVSCDVWRVEIAGRKPLVVKRALPKLRVQADWCAAPERSATEAAWLRLAGGIDATLAPPVIAEAPALHAFAMAFLPGMTMWKSALAAGDVDIAFAAKVGTGIARLQAATAGREDIALAFDHQDQFFALRLDPYLLHTARAHPDLAPRIEKVAKGIAAARIALMAGDISPKNIMVGAKGPVFIDAETACTGDPVFDLAFCLNHLLLKAAWHPEYAGAYHAAFAALKTAYLAGVTWEPAAEAEKRAAILLAMLLLARIDGKSSVEYLSDEAKRDAVRQVARELILKEETSLDAVAAAALSFAV